MPGGGMSRKRRGASTTAPTFRDMVSDVRREVPETAIETMAREQPGLFHTDARGVTVLAHPDGSVLHLREEGLTVADVRACIRAGADVFYNQEDCECCGTWRWYGSRELAGGLEGEPQRLSRFQEPVYDLYAGKAHHVVHILGDIAWGPIGPEGPGCSSDWR